MGVPRLGMAATPTIWDTVERLLFLGAAHMYGNGRVLCGKHHLSTAPWAVVYLKEIGLVAVVEGRHGPLPRKGNCNFRYSKHL